jgi:hemoglobin/transferrin/lactoferrin receptor protein
MKSIFTMCFLLVFSFAFAQEEIESEADSTETSYLSEITVSANRWEQNLMEISGKVSTVNRSLINFQNPQTAADLLTLTSNVFVQKSQLGGGSPMIRGFATNRVLLVVDGVRMNNAIFRSGNVQNVISLDANAVAETEVIFGPGSVIYGSDAIGGVMDFHTLKPAFSTEDQTSVGGNALARYSSANNEQTFHVDFNIGTKQWSFLTSVTRSLYDDLEMGSNGPEEYTRPDYVIRQNDNDEVAINKNPDLQLYTGYDQWNALQKISFKPNTWFQLTYGLHYSKTSDYARYDRLILKEEGQLANAEWYYGPQKWMMHTLDAVISKPAALYDQLKLTVAYQDYEESRHNRGFGSTRKTHRTENVKAFSINVDADKKLGEILTVYYGAEAILNKVGSVATRENINTGEITPTSTRYPDGSHWRSYAGYVSLKIRPSSNWLVNLSNRFTTVYTHASFDRTFFNFPFAEATLRNKSINGSVGIVYSPTATWKLYANLSSGFRAPNVDDIGKVFDSEPGTVVVPNPSLAPEQAYSIETGFAGSLSNNVKVDLALYHTKIDNAIARGFSTFNGEDSIDYDGVSSRVLSLQNISNVWVAGIQAGIEWQIIDGLSFYSSINYQKGKEKDPDTDRKFSPTHVAPLFGTTHFIYNWSKFKVDLYANYNGAIGYEDLALTERADEHLYAQDAEGKPYSPSWLTLNLKTSVAITERFMATLGVENITDRRYRPYSSGISAPGRNFIISLRASL